MAAGQFGNADRLLIFSEQVIAKAPRLAKQRQCCASQGCVAAMAPCSRVLIPGDGKDITIWTRTGFTATEVSPRLKPLSDATRVDEHVCIMTGEADIDRDAFALKPLVVFAAVIFVLGAALSFLQLPVFRGAAVAIMMPSLMIGIPAIIVWQIVVLIRLFDAIWKQRWRMTAAQALILLLVPPTAFVGLYIGPYVHFALSYPYYALQVRLSPAGGASPMRFNWGGAGAGESLQTDRWLIYDPNAEIVANVKPPETDDEASSAWYETEPLIGHFYLVERYQS
jgi:hypothetical protein